jgi:hypothetical protein
MRRQRGSGSGQWPRDAAEAETMRRYARASDELPIAPVQPRYVGRGLPLPPLIPMIAVICTLAGIVIGYGVAPRPATPLPSREAAPSSLVAASPAIESSPSPVEPDIRHLVVPDRPPANGLTLSEALAALSNSPAAAAPANIVSAEVVRFGAVANSGDAPSQQWVWVFTIRTTTVPSGGHICVTSSPGPSPRVVACPSAKPRPIPITEQVILDYMDGSLILSRAI